MDINEHIEVTQDDIRQGDPKNPQMCPVARAFRRINPHCRAIAVTPTQIRCVHGPLIAVGFAVGYGLPAGARRFIEAFDAEQPVAPLTFTLDMDKGASP